MQMAQNSNNKLHYCGGEIELLIGINYLSFLVCQMPIEYCCYNGEEHKECLKWLERNLPDVFAKLNKNDEDKSKYPIQTREPIVVVADFSSYVRDGRFASISSVDELKKYIVKSQITE